MEATKRREPRERWGKPYAYATPEGASVESKIEFVGYGFTHYEITGTPDAIEAEAARILARFPNKRYSTTIYWPPEKYLHHNTPVEISPGIWSAKGWRSNSSD